MVTLAELPVALLRPLSWALVRCSLIVSPSAWPRQSMWFTGRKLMTASPLVAPLVQLRYRCRCWLGWRSR
ncbi:hypothetical protein B8W73_01695 [Arthrobacter agilis]|nr:hypothetical protein B8W73_01695 [Arthrobacter agilis]